MNAPLYETLIHYGKNKKSFHMPGHKLGRAKVLKDIEPLLLDNTEAMGLDHLYHANGVIKEAMKLMARFYKVRDTFFLTNGATSGILASILAVVKEGEKVIVARNCHHSVWNALILSGAKPVYVKPRLLRHSFAPEGAIIGAVEKEAIREALRKHPDAKAVIIVSPTYEGIVSDIQAIAQEVHKVGKILIVDEAHGAHFCLEGFPKSSTQLGADIVINSLHKTLPVPTQSALIHIASERIDSQSVFNALEMIQTSSPSYMMMGMMDYVRSYIEENHSVIKKEYTEPLTALRKELKSLKKLKLIDLEETKYNPCNIQGNHSNNHIISKDKQNVNSEGNIERFHGQELLYDISKIVLSVFNTSISGYELAERLYKDYDIGTEAAFPDHIILMTSFADTQEDFDKLKDALFELDNMACETASKTTCKTAHKTSSCSIYDLSDDITEAAAPRKIYYSCKEWINLDLSLGKVIAQPVMLYPPGIPIGAVGERIDEKMVHTIRQMKDKLIGIKIEDDGIKVYVAEQEQ